MRGPLLATLLILALVLPGNAAANLPSQENGRIAWQHGAGEIWVLNPAAAAPDFGAVKLTTGSALEAKPSWGPAFHQQTPAPHYPSYLAYQRFENGDWDIWARPLDGDGFGVAAPLVSGPGDQVDPVFSDAITPVAGVPSSGTALLAYVEVDATGARSLWLRDGTGAQTLLTSRGSGFANPDFGGRFRLVNGTREHADLVFEATMSGRQGLWTTDLEVNVSSGALVSASVPRLIVEDATGPSWQVTNPKTGGDAVRDLLFTTRAAGVDYLDYLEESRSVGVPFADPTLAARYPLTGNPGGDGDAVWAPFGDRIVLTRTIAGDADLWVIAPDGTGLQRLTASSGPDTNASWEPKKESSADVVGGHVVPGPVTRGESSGGGGDTGGGGGGDNGGGGGGGDNGGGGNTGGGGGGGNSGGSNTNGDNRQTKDTRRSPRITLKLPRWHGTRVSFSGTLGARTAGRLLVRFSCSGGATSTKVRPSNLRFSGSLQVPARCRHARRGKVSAGYGGDNGLLAQTVSRRVRRR